MTITNHVLTGALLAVVLRKPELAIPLALVSHYILDMLPHYGYGNIPHEKRDTMKHFLLKQTIDAYLALGLFFLVPYLVRGHVAPVVTAYCMAIASIPDAVWAYQYVKAQPHRTGQYSQPGPLTRFHKAIQWCERPWGIYVELAWFALTIVAMRLVTT